MFARLTRRVASVSTNQRRTAVARAAAGERAFGARVGFGAADAAGASAREWLVKALGAVAAGGAGVGLLMAAAPARAEAAPVAAGAAATSSGAGDAKATAQAKAKSGTDLKSKLFYTATVVFMPIAAMIRFAGRRTRRGNISMPAAGWAVSALGYSAVLPEQLSVALAAAGCAFIPLSVGGFDLYTRRTGRTRQVQAMNRFVAALPERHPLVWQRLSGAGYPPLSKRPSPELGVPRADTFAPAKADGSAAELSTGRDAPKIELIQTSRAFDPNYNVNCLFYLNSSHDFARVALRELISPKRAAELQSAAKTAGAGNSGNPHLQVTPYEVTFGARKYQPFWFWNNRTAMDVTAAEQHVIDRILATSDSDNRVQVMQYAWAMPPNPSKAATQSRNKPAYLHTPRPNGADGDQPAPPAVIGEWVLVGGATGANGPVPAWDAIIRGVHGRLIETVYAVDANGGTVVEWIDVRTDAARFLLHGGAAGVLPATDPKAGPVVQPAPATPAASKP